MAEKRKNLGSRRQKTDRSLDDERLRTNQEVTRVRREADERTRAERGELDQRRARATPAVDAEAGCGGAVARERCLADRAVRQERAQADAAIREERRASTKALLLDERRRTDEDLADERVETDRCADAQDVALAASKAATRARDDFLGIVAHDLKNPLHVIHMNAGMLSRLATPTDEPGRRTRKAADAILRATESMRSLIEDLLDVASIEAERLSVRKEPQNVRALLCDANQMLEAVAAEKDVSLECAADETLELPCDRERMFQVVGNLVSNAIRFTPAGGSVIVSAAAEGGGVHFTVRDTGAGIPADHLERIFDRYFQGRGGGRKGAGLGLFIARGIVAAHGGRIWAESELGKGSTFHFVLPEPARR